MSVQVRPADKSASRRGRHASLIRAAVCVSVLYLGLALTFSVLVPAWENNDETSHVQYIEHIVRHGTPPHIALSNGIESHQPPLYYYIEAGWQKLLGIAAFTPHINPPGGPPLAPTQRVFEVSHDYTPSQQRAAHAVHFLRLPSIAMGWAAVLAAVATGWLLCGDALLSGAMGATVALWPKFLVVTSAVTNSALSISLAACVVPVFLLWQRRRGWPLAAAVGALLGAGAIAEDTVLPLAGLALLLLLVQCVRTRDLRSATAAIGAFVLVSGWWFVRETIVYGSPLASAQSRDYLLNDPLLPGLVRATPSLSLPILRAAISGAAHSTWYDGGWNQLQLPHSLDDVIWVLAGISFLAALKARPARRWILLASAVGAIVAWLAIVRATSGAEGRYLLVGIVAWAAFLVLGAERLSFGSRIGLWFWPVLMAGLDVYVMSKWLIPYGHV